MSHPIDDSWQVEPPDEEPGEYEQGDFFEGDMDLDEEQLALIFGDRNVLIEEKYRWPNETVPYKLSLNHSVAQHAKILEAMKKIEEVSCVRFIQQTNETDYVQFQVGYFRFFPLQIIIKQKFLFSKAKERCYSKVGRRGGEQILNLQRFEVGIGCFRIGTIVHELLHALGFHHMQSAHDRDNYVRINWKNIKKGYKSNFMKYDSSIASNFNVFYDYGSIMHYSRTAFAKDESIPTIEPLVSIDKHKIFDDFFQIKLK